MACYVNRIGSLWFIVDGVKAVPMKDGHTAYIEAISRNRFGGE